MFYDFVPLVGLRMWDFFKLIYIRSFQIKRDWFCMFHYKNSFLGILKTNFYVFLSKNSQYSVVLEYVYIFVFIKNHYFY